MLSFPCFSKYFESFVDVRTYSIVFPRKIVVPRVIPFPRVIASPSLLVKKKIDTIYSFLLHPFTLAHSTPGSVCQKKKKVTAVIADSDTWKVMLKLNPIQIDWFMSSLNQFKETKLSGSSRLLFLKAPKQKTKKWDCSLSNLASFRMRMFSLFDVTFSWRTASYKKNLK